ncbi:MAG: hypothetical protein ABSH37_08850 [Bryobacteraceae bacterium]
MRHTSRYQIEKYANKAFAGARTNIHAEYEEERKRVLDRVRLTGNSGGYLPALTNWGAERLRKTVRALANAYVEAFALYGAPSDAGAEAELKTAARQMAAGTISGIQGELRLMRTRTGKRSDDPGGYLNRTIEAAMESAVEEGVLNLMRQRATSGDIKTPSPGIARTQQTATVVFGTSRPITVVRDAGTAAEFRWDTCAGGDFKKYLLFRTQDRVKTCDGVHCELFDEPRIIVRVDPDLMQGGVRNWRATITPRSLWRSGHQASPERPEPAADALRKRTDNPELQAGQEPRQTEPKSKMAPADIAASQEAQGSKKRGRRSNRVRRDAIKKAILTHGEAWRDHLSEIFEELDREKADLGAFQNRKIDLGDGLSQMASSWDDLGLADGNQRTKLIDALRKYLD